MRASRQAFSETVTCAAGAGVVVMVAERLVSPSFTHVREKETLSAGWGSSGRSAMTARWSEAVVLSAGFGRVRHHRVAAAEVVNDVVLVDLGQLAHLIDDIVRRCHPADDDLVRLRILHGQIDFDLSATLEGDFVVARDLRVVVWFDQGLDFEFLAFGFVQSHVVFGIHYLIDFLLNISKEIFLFR